MRVSEVYASVQGEGPNVGKTTVFTRFGGCNLRCPGWPCDTQHAIQPTFRHEWMKRSSTETAMSVMHTADMAGAKLITLTGGEPFLQKTDEVFELADILKGAGYEIEAFTNGTLLYPDWAVRGISMIMDWKLPGSGEDPMNDNRLHNIKELSKSDLPHAVKFVCKDIDDILKAHSLWSLYLKDTPLRVYYGKVWDGEITDAELAKYVMYNKLPWSLNVQLHNYIWPANERGR